MHPAEIDGILHTLTVLVDTREQPTPQLKKRLDQIRFPVLRRKLEFGDYSAQVTLPSGEALDFSSAFSVERKMNLTELCGCFCQQRERFAREFERAKAAGAKLYLLVEDASWEQALRGDYRSRMAPNALVASMTAWLARYDCQLLLCSARTSGRLIREILYREAKERLEAMADGRDEI